MEWLSGNAFFLVLLLVCVGMHVFGHGRSHNDGRRMHYGGSGHEGPDADDEHGTHGR